MKTARAMVAMWLRRLANAADPIKTSSNKDLVIQITADTSQAEAAIDALQSKLEAFRVASEKIGNLERIDWDVEAGAQL